MLNSKNLTIVKQFGDKTEFTIAKSHCTYVHEWRQCASIKTSQHSPLMRNAFIDDRSSKETGSSKEDITQLFNRTQCDLYGLHEYCAMNMHTRQRSMPKWKRFDWCSLPSLLRTPMKECEANILSTFWNCAQLRVAPMKTARTKDLMQMYTLFYLINVGPRLFFFKNLPHLHMKNPPIFCFQQIEPV